MARLARNGVPAVLVAAAAWKQACLERDGSVFGVENLWTRENAEQLHDAFYGHLIEDSARRFYDKLEEQLRPLPSAVVRLAAELTWVMMLFPSGINADRKRRDVSRIYGWSGQDLPESHPLLGEPLENGVGHAGTAFNTHRWREFGYFLKFLCAWKALPEAKRSQCLADPWAMAAWIDDETPSKKRALRHILLYLLFPDHFERIANTRHRRAIVAHFDEQFAGRPDMAAVKALARLDLDRRILTIRSRLESQYQDQQIDFYTAPVADTFRIEPKLGDRKRKPRIAAPADIDPYDPVSARQVAELYSDDPSCRRAALSVFAQAVETADAVSPMRWSISLNRHRIGLNVGRILIAQMRRDRFGLTVLEGRIGADPKEAAETERLLGLPFESFASISGARFIKIPAQELGATFPGLEPGLTPAIEAASQTARRPTGMKGHASGVLEYLDQELGRKLPRPGHQVIGGSIVVPAIPVTTPIAGFRATELDLESLMSDVDVGDIGLPDIQRPFVWTAAKVRDLFDSMYRGYPVGYLLFWETGTSQQAARVIGVNDKAFKAPKRLIVDGQQRLTSLYAVMRGATILDDEYRHTKIEIAFRPRDGRFEVADAAIRRDPEFIGNISEFLTDNRGSYTLIHGFLDHLAQRRQVTDQDRQIIGQNLDRLFGLKRYRFSVLQISADLQEEAVADIFVRINSEGVKLNQSDFILTLLSVIWEEGRTQLEAFSRQAQRPPDRAGGASPYNHLIAPSPDQMLRVCVATAFSRARMKSVYHLLRGKDPDTGDIVLERRQEQMSRLQAAQAKVLDLDNWHRFIGCITQAGFRLSDQVSSENALLMAYALYLRGLECEALAPVELDRLIGRWFTMAVLTSRFSGSPETVMEQDLARAVLGPNGRTFRKALEAEIEAALTGDYWRLTLPLDLDTSSTRSPGWAAFVAAQLRLGAPVLFSDKKLWALLDPLARGNRRPFEAHHLFPKAWLIGQGIAERKLINQVGNLAFLEWPANVRASSRGPASYVPELRTNFDDAAWEQMCRLHALPPNWEHMGYFEFLTERRKLMAELIWRGFETLTGGPVSSEIKESGGSQAEQKVWQEIADLERSLRGTIRRSFASRWHDGADVQIKKLLGADAMAVVDRNREKYLQQYKFSQAPHGDEILDFLYLGQLVMLMTSGTAWDLFSGPFRDKRQLQDLVASVLPVRNDSAHFRSVPDRELDRCRLAVGDLRVALEKL